MFRFRRFSLRLLAWLLGLLFAALFATYESVAHSNAANARDHAAANLELAARVFDAAVRQRIEYLVGSANVMTGDDAIKQVLADGDTKTLSSALVSYTQRVGAPVIAIFDPDGKLLANREPDMANENTGRQESCWKSHNFHTSSACEPARGSVISWQARPTNRVCRCTLCTLCDHEGFVLIPCIPDHCGVSNADGFTTAAARSNHRLEVGSSVPCCAGRRHRVPSLFNRTLLCSSKVLAIEQSCIVHPLFGLVRLTGNDEMVRESVGFLP